MPRYGRGYGRGRGWRFGGYGPGGFGGYGPGWGFGGWGGYWGPPFPMGSWGMMGEIDPEEEREMLLDYKAYLEEELKAVEDRLREIEEETRR